MYTSKNYLLVLLFCYWSSPISITAKSAHKSAGKKRTKFAVLVIYDFLFSTISTKIDIYIGVARMRKHSENDFAYCMWKYSSISQFPRINSIIFKIWTRWKTWEC